MNRSHNPIAPQEIPELQIFKTQLHTHMFRLHSHTSWELLYYMENSGSLHLENQPDIPFVPGTVICVPPEMAHGSEALTGDFVNISIEDPAFPLGHLSSGGCLVAEDNYNRELYQLVTMIYRLHAQQSADKLRPEEPAFRIRHLLTCVYDILSEQLAHLRRTTDGVERVKGYLQDRYMDPAYTAAMAIRDSGYSQNYMRAQFLEQCGVTPTRYLTELRLENARCLLEACSPALSVTEVASRSGFGDALYFSKVFRKRYGVAPSRYKSDENKGDNHV